MRIVTMLLVSLTLEIPFASAVARAADPSPAAAARQILRSSHAVYAGAHAVEDHMDSEVDDGGGHPSRSSMDVLLGPGEDVALVGTELGVARMGDAFVVFRPSPGGVYWSTPAEGSFEDSQQKTFGAEGSGLPVPPALTLRRSDDLELLVRTLSQGALSGVTVTRVDQAEVEGKVLDVIEARCEMGTIAIRFDRSASLLRSATARLELPSDGGVQRIVADFRFKPRVLPAGGFGPRFTPENRRRVERATDVVALSGPQPGEDVSALTFSKPGGETMSLAGHRGSVVVLDFWASWCIPCRAVSKQVDEARHQALGQGIHVPFYGVNTLETGEADARARRVRKWWSDAHADYPVLIDHDDAAAKALRIGNLPLVVVIGRDGRIAWARVGYSQAGGEALLAGIRKAMEE